MFPGSPAWTNSRAAHAHSPARSFAPFVAQPLRVNVECVVERFACLPACFEVCESVVRNVGAETFILACLKCALRGLWARWQGKAAIGVCFVYLLLHLLSSLLHTLCSKVLRCYYCWLFAPSSLPHSFPHLSLCHFAAGWSCWSCCWFHFYFIYFDFFLRNIFAATQYFSHSPLCLE